jgi:hypothetical protein
MKLFSVKISLTLLKDNIMAGVLTVVPTISDSNFIKGQPFSVVAKITGIQGITDNVKVSISDLPGVTLLSNFQGEVLDDIFTQNLVIIVDGNNSEYKISFSANTSDKLTTDVTYQAVNSPDLDPDSCRLVLSSSYLFDLNPVDSDYNPTNNNPFINASINPKKKDGTIISNYEIHLRTESEVRIFTPDMDEIKPYDIPSHTTYYENLYYDYLIPKLSEDTVNLRIYATKNLNGFVTLETEFNGFDIYTPEKILIMYTDKIKIAQGLDSPIIEEASSSNLTRPNESKYFHLEIPSSEFIRFGSYLIGFTSDNYDNPYKKQLFLYEIINEDYKYIFKCNYAYLYEGNNFISYIAINKFGFPEGSLIRNITYTSGNNNIQSQLKWSNPITQAKTNESIHEELLIIKDNKLLSGINVTCVLDNDNIVFKDTKNQIWTGKTDEFGSINISVISLTNTDSQFTINAYLTDNHSIQAPPLSVRFISSINNKDLAPPFLPQAENGVINVSELSQDILVVLIEQYNTPRIGDEIIIHINNNISSIPFFIANENIKNQKYQITIPFSYIPSGSYEIFYTITNVDNKAEISASGHVIINGL